jgi:flagellar L-ring protein FlgH
MLAAFAGVALSASAAWADDLYLADRTQSLASDRRASQVGDILTVVVVQAAESSTIMQNGTRRATTLNGHLDAGPIDEGGSFAIGRGFDGKGEVRRSELFVTQMTATIADILPNGDYTIVGNQTLRINGETTLIEVHGRVRPNDIDSENRVASNRIADAQIRYNGKGFVSRSAKPGIIQRIFSFLGL